MVSALLLSFVICLSPSVFAEEVAAVPASESQPTYVMCRFKNVVRTIRVETQDGCVAKYTKEGVDQVVGKSGTNEVCFKVMNNIRENLEKADWKCKDISQARVSTSLSE